MGEDGYRRMVCVEKPRTPAAMSLRSGLARVARCRSTFARSREDENAERGPAFL